MPRGSLTAFAVLVLAVGPLRAADGKLQYNRDIRPILAENCFACHGPDKNARKADLRLDIREDAVKAKAFLPGNPDESALVERVFATPETGLMPPEKSHKKLTAAQKNTLKRWVAEGAEYQPHWAYIPPVRPTPPAVKEQGWVRNPIDQFILAELERRGLKPAPEADRYTLARRLALDLTGLPPNPADVEAFVKDTRMDAYERYVDKLLASPYWGEHRGRYWLDAARYADSHGIHFDNFREMWSYREWVIKAFNDNKRFNTFTIEQLAGDLLPSATVEQKVASGFNRCNITTNEGGAINEEYLVLYTRDRTETVSQVWMGMTAGCAVCHDHKLDPLSQREFYQMAAFFNNTTQAAMDGNIKDTPPILQVPKLEDRARWEAVQKEIATAREKLAARKQAASKEFDAWLKATSADKIRAELPADKLYFHAKFSEGTGNAVKLLVEGKERSVETQGAAGWLPGQVADKGIQFKPGVKLDLTDVGDFDKDQAFSVSAWVRIPRGVQAGPILARMDNTAAFRGWDFWYENGKVGMHIINAWQTDALKVVAGNLKPDEWHHVTATYDGSAKASGVQVYIDGVLQTTRDIQADALKSTIKTKVPLKFASRHTSEPLANVAVQDVRIYTRALNGEEAARLAKGTRTAYLLGIEKRTPAQNDELQAGYIEAFDPQSRELSAQVAKLQVEENAIRARGTIAHVMNEKPSEALAYILFRGDYDKRRDAVKPGTPRVLPAMPDTLPRNRLGFAEWLLRPEHPLTARVTVNRFWQEIFGQGLVRTSGDFGIAGELPSHPELLDWLAVEFRESNWDVKQFFKMIVTSAAYRQSALTTPDKREKDPANALISRGPRFRMDAEMIRDYALASSGLLVHKLGGPSVKPYQPEGVWEAVAMIGSNTRDYKADTGEGLYRRSLYTFWKRAAPPASMEIFNAPNRETCAVRRERTNTPLQALVTLNDPQFIEAARVLAQQAILLGGSTTETRLDYLARHLLSRPLRPKELQTLTPVLTDLLAHYKADQVGATKLVTVGENKRDPKVPADELAAWTMLTNAMMNLDEVLCK
jgi:hypothetical protein